MPIFHTLYIFSLPANPSHMRFVSMNSVETQCMNMLDKNPVEEYLMNSLWIITVINIQYHVNMRMLPSQFVDKPHNPLLNSGAIMSAAILLNLVNPDMKMSEKFDFVSDYIKRLAGGEFIR